MSDRLVLRGGRVVDPATDLDVVGDVLVEGGWVAAIGNGALGVERRRGHRLSPG